MAKTEHDRAQHVLIGYLLNYPSTAPEILERLPKEESCAFTKRELRRVYEVIHDLHERGAEIRQHIVSEEFQRRGWSTGSLPTTFVECSDAASNEFLSRSLGESHLDYVNAVRGGYYLGVVQEKAQRANSFDEFIAVAEEAIALDAGKQSDSQRPVSEVIDELIDTQIAIKEGRQRAGYSWGIPRLDDTLLIRPGRFYTVAAPTGAAKTQFLLSVLDHNLSNNETPVPCLFFSLEMGELEVVKCLASRRTEIDSSLILTRYLSDDLFEQIKQGTTALRTAPLEIDASSNTTVKEIISRIRRWKHKNQIPDNTGVVAIDFLQLLSLDRERGQLTEATALKNAAYALAGAAKSMKLAIIVVAQFNKMASGQVPHLRFIEGSGGVGQASHGVVLLDLVRLREEGGCVRGPVEPFNIIVAKNRDGESGVTIDCEVNLATGKFYEMDSRSLGIAR